MRDSDTYQAILDEGREEQIKKDIHCLAQRLFGAAVEPTLSRLNGITDLERLRRIYGRLLDVTNWQDLLDTP